MEQGELALTETIFTSPTGFGVTTATNCQRAWCRILDGLPLGALWMDPEVRAMFNGVRPPELTPEEFVGITGPRTGKSLIVASKIVGRALMADLSAFPKTENPPHIPVTSVHKVNATAILGHVGKLMSRPPWASRRVGVPRKESVTIRNRWGHDIEIQVIAGSRSAANLQSFWHLMAVVDEAFLLPGESDAVVNLDDVRVALRGRILPPGPTAYIGSPWSPVGPAHELTERYWSSGGDQNCIVAWTNGPAMNPFRWTPEFCEKLRTSKDQRDQDAYQTGALGRFLQTTGGVLGDSEIRAAMRENQILPPRPGVEYCAAMDPATRRNAWSLVIGHREGERVMVDSAVQWMPRAGEKLDPGGVLFEVARLIAPYRLSTVFSDQWSSDALESLARCVGVTLVEHSLRGAAREEAYRLVVDGVRYASWELPQDDGLRRDLMSVRRRVGISGPQYYLVETPDGRHADFVPALALLAVLAPASDRVPLADTFDPDWFSGRAAKEPVHPHSDWGLLTPVDLDSLIGSWD